MKKIDSISVERLDNGSHFMFMNDVNTRIKTEAYLMQKESLASLVSALDKAVQKEDECLKLSRKLFTTDQIKDLDDLRDDPAGAGADKGEIVEQARPKVHVGSLSLYVGGWVNDAGRVSTRDQTLRTAR